MGVFAPLKAAWRQVLTNYKLKHPNQVGIPKVDFPNLLNTLIETANPGQHLPAAFNRHGSIVYSMIAIWKNWIRNYSICMFRSGSGFVPVWYSTN
jgi:hypothetical protein